MSTPSPDTTQRPTRGHRKERIGRVSSHKADKTITVVVERRVPHPLYGKIIRRFSKFYAHDEKNEAREGDRVLIQETRPLSKLKSWRLVKIVERDVDAETAAEPAQPAPTP